MTPDTLILLPAYNEGGRIGAVVRAVREVAGKAGVVVVDDGSADDTGSQAKAAGAEVLRLPFNAGYGVALQTGYKYALERGVNVLIQLDGDGQHDPGSVPALYRAVVSGRADLVVGSRFLEGRSYSIPWARRLGMILLRRVASALIGQTITDPTSGFQAMNRKVITFFAGDHYPVDYPDTDVLVLVHRRGFRIAEIPAVMHPDASGKSMHGGVRPLYYLFKMALIIPLNLIRREA